MGNGAGGFGDAKVAILEFEEMASSDHPAEKQIGTVFVQWCMQHESVH